MIPTPNTIDLNADLGERPAQLADDIALMQHVTSINIACGGHAGDEPTARKLIQIAASKPCNIGAHPSYPDRPGFGRIRLDMTFGDLEACIAQQVEWLAHIARSEGAALRHVKPHGALYHAANDDPAVARAVAHAVRSVDASLVLVGQAGAPALQQWRGSGLAIAAEGFADRAYAPDGTLRSRALPGAVIVDPATAAQQALFLACNQIIKVDDVSTILMTCTTICIHSDTPHALAIARAVRKTLEQHGINLAPF